MILKFSDEISREVYKSVYNRVKNVKNPWWICITEGVYVDGEFTIVPHYVIGKESNIVSAIENMYSIGLDINMIINRTLGRGEYEWESVEGDLEEISLHFSVVRVSKKGEVVLWEHIKPEESLKEYM